MVDITLKALQFRERGGYTLRYHGIRMIGQDTVGHHSYNVAQILRYIVNGETGVRIGVLLEAALDHDIAECVTGDMPAPTKRAIPGLRESFAEYEDTVMEENGVFSTERILTPKEAKLLKIADAADGMRFCLQEFAMGNTFAKSIFNTFASYVATLLEGEPMGRAHDLFNAFMTRYYELGGTYNVGE